MNGLASKIGIIIFMPGKWFVTSDWFLEGFWQSVTCGCRKRRRGGGREEGGGGEGEGGREGEGGVGGEGGRGGKEEGWGGRKGGNSTTTVTPAPSTLLQSHFQKFRKQQAC